MRTYLKIKIKSLAAEAVIIKQEERKWKFPVFTDNVKQPHPMFFALRQHRLLEVRRECRSAIIAYGYLRGRAYKQIEAFCYERPDWNRVAELVFKYGKGNWNTATSSKDQFKLLVEILKSWREERLEAQAAE
jgi:uncharacterized protein (UPF0548 family)